MNPGPLRRFGSVPVASEKLKFPGIPAIRVRCRSSFVDIRRAPPKALQSCFSVTEVLMNGGLLSMERFVVLPQVMSSRELEGDPPSQAPASAPKGKNLQLILLLLLQPPKLNHGQFRVYASVRIRSATSAPNSVGEALASPKLPRLVRRRVTCTREDLRGLFNDPAPTDGRLFCRPSGRATRRASTSTGENGWIFSLRINQRQ